MLIHVSVSFIPPTRKNFLLIFVIYDPNWDFFQLVFLRSCDQSTKKTVRFSGGAKQNNDKVNKIIVNTSPH